VYLAPEPLLSVVIGTGRALENIEAMKGLFSQPGFD
jgi:actin-like ATPase involved in cell morphogenesis